MGGNIINMWLQCIPTNKWGNHTIPTLGRMVLQTCCLMCLRLCIEPGLGMWFVQLDGESHEGVAAPDFTPAFTPDTAPTVHHRPLPDRPIIAIGIPMTSGQCPCLTRIRRVRALGPVAMVMAPNHHVQPFVRVHVIWAYEVFTLELKREFCY